jgi:5'-nucleotidase
MSMRILVTNDDGIHADGLKSLERIAAALSGDVWVVAPEVEQSGSSHSLSLHLPVRVRHISDKRYAVSGTPTDCVLLALKEIIKGKVDLVLSGVNRGSNAGDDITYSGTVAAAMEGVMLNVPSIALSQLCDDRPQVFWETTEKLAPDLIKKLVAAGWPPNVFINLNFPDCAPGDVKGVRVCPQGKRRVNVNLTGRVDPKKRPYYWIGGERDNEADRAGVDIDLLHKGYVTVTPLSMDLTDYQTLEKLTSLNVS